MPNVNKILLAATLVLVLALVVILWREIRSPADDYYAVLTMGGDLFFGKLHRFPRMYLTDIWTIQQNPQDKENPIRLVKFEHSF